MMSFRLLLAVAIVACGFGLTSRAHAQVGCVPNPNLSGPPFTDGCPLPASALNNIVGVGKPCLNGAAGNILGAQNSSFSNPTCGTRAPLFIKNDPTAAQITAGYNTGLQIWTGYNPTGTPGAGGAVSATFYIDNLNARGEIWAWNAVCIQYPVGQQFTGSGAGAGNGINHCTEVNFSQANAPQATLSAFAGGSVAHGFEIVPQSPSSGFNPQVDLFLWSPNNPLTTTIVTTGNTHGTNIIDGIANLVLPASAPASLIGQVVTCSDCPANTTVTSVDSASQIHISQTATGTHTSISVTFQSVAGAWPLFGVGCWRVVYACIQSGNGAGNFFNTDTEGTNQIAFLWDTGGSQNVLRADGSHAASIFNFQNITNASQLYVALPVTLSSNFLISNGAAFATALTIDSGVIGGSPAQQSSLYLSDRGTLKWQMVSNSANDLNFINVSTGHAILKIFTATEAVNLPVVATGTPVASLCIDAGGNIIKKTTTGSCI